MYTPKKHKTTWLVLLQLKLLSLFLVALFTASVVFAQPPNDDPCNAIQLTVTNSCIYQSFTTAGATGSTGVPAPGCAGYNGGDVWFKVTVPCSGTLRFDSQTGGMLDGGMAIYTGSCNNLNLIACDDDASINGDMPSITVTPVPGSTVWVRMWEAGNDNPGSFGICASLPPPPPPGATCQTASPFCNSNAYTFYNNINVPSLGGGGIYGCLGYTPNPVFFYMQIDNPGDMSIHIVETDGSGNIIDVDYALWGPFPDHASSCGLSPSNLVSCSFSPSGDETAVITGAQTGEFYTLLLTNFANQQGTISFQQSAGNASTTCGIICNITAANSGPVCPGQSFNLSSNITGGLPGAIYTWSGFNCFSSSSQNPTGITAPSVAGNYPYTVTATTPSGTSCSATTTLVVGGFADGSAVAANTSCSAFNDGSITVTPPTTGGPFSYTLNPGNIIQPNNPVFPNLSPATYNITISNGSGCTQTITGLVVQPAVAIGASAIASATSCPAISNGTITINPPATGGPFVYTLNPGNIVNNNNPVFSGLAALNYTISFINAAGCPGTVTSGTNVMAGPVLTPNSPVLVNPPCATIHDGIITIVPSIAGNYTYTLNPGLPGQIIQINNPVFPGLAPGTYPYSFTNGAGCTGTGTALLTTHSPLSINIVKSMPLCYGNNNGSIVLNASGGLGPYQYALSPFTSYQGGTFSGLAAGNYTFQVKDNAGCTKTATVTLVQPVALAASAINPSDETCNGNDGVIVITANGGTPAYQYLLQTGGSYQAANNFYVPAGNYSDIIVKDSKGCQAAVAAVNVIRVDNLFLNAGNDTTICAGQPVHFFPQTNPQTNKFKWTTLPDPLQINTIDNDTLKNATATPVDTTGYVLSVKWGVCEKKDTVAVFLKHKPVPDAGPHAYVCFDNKITTLTGNAYDLSGPVHYEWTDTQHLQTPHSSISIATPDTTEIFILTVTDQYGCNFSERDSVLVTVQPPVPAFAGNDTIAITGIAHQLMATGGVGYSWMPTAPLNLATAQNPLATLYNDQQFTVTVTDVGGCIGRDTVFIKAFNDPGYYMPNAFTPNGDGLNDVFRAIPVGISYTEYFRIFNRYGEMLFSTNKWLKGWDGTYLGKKQQAGTYVWIIKGLDRKGNKVELKGTVMLVR